MVTIVPQVRVHSINKDTKYLILACDGIWDCRSSQETVDYFSQSLWSDPKKAPFSDLRPKEQLAEAIGELFLENCPKPGQDAIVGKDNMSCILIEFKKAFAK